MMQKLITDLTEAELDAASTDVLATALVFRLRHFQYMLSADLEELEARLPGFGAEGKLMIADGLEQLAMSLRTSPIPAHWKPTRDILKMPELRLSPTSQQN